MILLFREHMPGLFRKRVNLDTYELPTVEPEHGMLYQSLGGSFLSSLKQFEDKSF